MTAASPADRRVGPGERRLATTLAVAAVALYLVAAAVLLSRPAAAADDVADGDADAAASAVAVATPVESSRRKAAPLPRLGFAMALHHTDHLDAYLESIDQIAEAGFNHLHLATPMFQRDGADDRVQRIAGRGRGPEPEQIRKLLAHARRRGLTTSLMPIVLFTEPRGNEWRGKLQPESWPRWWASYERRMLEFASLAAEQHVDYFSVGSELLSTERQTDRWRGLIKRVKRRYGGSLFYSTNWDHYHVPAFWAELDFIGVNGYWDLTRGADGAPTDNHLARRWAGIRDRLHAFADEQGRPIFLTEVGYPTLPTALAKPWDYIRRDQVRPAPEVQARGFAAFCRAFADVPYRLHAADDAPASKHGASNATDPIAGVFFYKWDPYYRGGEGDFGYGVRGKPAAAVLADWLGADRDRATDAAE